MTGWHELGIAALSAILSLPLVWAGTYLLKLILVPAVLHREQAAIIDELTSQNQRLQQALPTPPVSPEEEQRQSVVLGMLRSYGKSERETLQFILDRGEVSELHLTFSGIERVSRDGAIAQGLKDGLVAVQGDYFTINPALRTALFSVLRTIIPAEESN